MKEKRGQILCGLSGILVLVSVAVMYLVHRAVPFMMDDLWYATKLSSDTPIASFGDIIESQIWHYYNWGGRSITHGMLQVTLLLGEHAADILNVAVTLLLAGIICIAAGNDKKGMRLPFFFAAIGMLLGLNANWKMSMFWQAGAANYLYITVFILIFLHCYLREAAGEAGKLPGITIWMLPLGLVTGWSNENMGPAAWVISVVVIFLCIKEKRKVKPWMILGSLSALAGSILVVAAPGNFVRSGQVASNEYGALWNVFLRCYAESKAALEYLFPTLLLLGFLLLISKGLLQIPIGRKNALLLFAALLSWGAMILSPHYPDRAAFGTMVMLICVILSLTKDVLEKRKELSPWFFGAAVFVWLRGMYFLGEYLALCWGWIK